jgi:hypothetical protein
VSIVQSTLSTANIHFQSFLGRSTVVASTEQ